MELIHIENDVKLFCVTSESFPDGILRAFEALENKLPTKEGRVFYGISQPDIKGSIVYKAAVAESFDNEGRAAGCEPFILEKGTYVSETITGFMSDPGRIGLTFQKLLKDPRRSDTYPCIEWYINETDVVCMIQLKD